MPERLTLPVLPLREVVLFPGVTAPIGAGRPATLRAIESALSQPERLVFAVSQRQNVESLSPEDPAFVALHREARTRAAELGQKSGLPDEVVQQVLAGVNDPGKFADLVAGYIDITPQERQILLETLSVEERLRRVLVHVQRQIGVLDAQEDIKSQVQEELGERQREMFLREQLKTIQRELGEEDEATEVEELR